MPPQTKPDTSKRPTGMVGYERPLVVASYFGFRPIEAPRVKRSDLEIVKDLRREPHYDPAERASLIRTYIERNMMAEAHPLALSYKRPSSRSEEENYEL